ncbi:MAG: GNAT family N-acetyltransferase [Acidimicrobiales bacterium]
MDINPGSPSHAPTAARVTGTAPFTDEDTNDLFTLHTKALLMRYWDVPLWGESGHAGRLVAACLESASLGYCSDDAAWGHGYATEAARGLLGWAFDTLDLNHVQAETDTRNVASARVLEKLGFVREGTRRRTASWTNLTRLAGRGFVTSEPRLS